MTPPQEGRHVTFVHGRPQRLMIFLAGQLSLRAAPWLLKTSISQQVMLNDGQHCQQLGPARFKREILSLLHSSTSCRKETWTSNNMSELGLSSNPQKAHQSANIELPDDKHFVASQGHQT